MSTTVNVPKGTVTATSGCARRHVREATTASAASSSGRAMSWRSTASTKAQQLSATTKAQSCALRVGGFVGRGSTDSERSASAAF